MMKGSLFATTYLEKLSSLKKGRKHLLLHMIDNLNRNLLAVERWLFLQVLCLTLFLLFSSSLQLDLLQGVPTNEPIITKWSSDGPAQAAGMKDGDFVKEVDGKPIGTWQEFAEIIQESPGVPLQFEVERNGDSVTLEVVPDTLKEAGQEFGQIGVRYTSPVEKNPLKAVQYGAEQTLSGLRRIFELLGMLVTGKFTIDALSGPVGIYKATEEVAQYGIL